MTVDDSFTKPGAIPFKWEIRPGVPKVQQQQLKQQKQRLPPPPLPPPASPFINQRSFTNTPPATLQRKLKPPPPGSYYYILSPEPRSQSFRSTPRTRSRSFRFDPPTRVRTECASPGCFPAPLLRRKESKRRTQKLEPEPEPEPDYVSYLETRSRWSVSSRRSLSPFYSSPASSFSSFRSSPRPVPDEWAGFGLF